MQSMLTGEYLYGIDVSHHQETIDWLTVSKKGTVDTPDGKHYPVSIALIKATEGIGYVDPMFRRNAGGADAVGIKTGYYHYAHPENNAADVEAQAFVDAVKGMPGKLWYVLDIEGGAAAALGREKLVPWCKLWLETVKKKTNHPVAIYTGGAFAKDYLGPELSGYPLWVAHYGVTTPMANPYWNKWTGFQFTSSGRVSGIDFSVAKVDFSAFDKASVDALLAPPVDYAGRWSTASVQRVINSGIMVGDGNGNFRPTDGLTREEMAEILCQLSDKGFFAKEVK